MREIHISGGSWEDSSIKPDKKIRRDTHDNPVPGEVFHLLKLCIHKCPNLKYIVMEQLSNGLDTEEKRILFREDFVKMSAIINEESSAHDIQQNSFLPENLEVPGLPIEDELLKAQQSTLSNILENAASFDHAKKLLQSSILTQTEWETEKWEPHMLETAIAIAQKWKHRFA